jgi:hypothetical protein
MNEHYRYTDIHRYKNESYRQLCSLTQQVPQMINWIIPFYNDSNNIWDKKGGWGITSVPGFRKIYLEIAILFRNFVI